MTTTQSPNSETDCRFSGCSKLSEEGIGCNDSIAILKGVTVGVLLLSFRVTDVTRCRLFYLGVH